MIKSDATFEHLNLVSDFERDILHTKPIEYNV